MSYIRSSSHVGFRTSPNFYNPNNPFDDYGKIQSVSGNKHKLHHSSENFHKFLIRNFNKLKKNVLLLNKFMNKFFISLFLIIITFIILFYQFYISITYYNPPNYWYYLEPSQFDFISDNEVVELLKKLPNLEISDFTKNDRRLIPALYLNNVLNHLIENNGELNPNSASQFSWSDWIDFDNRLLPSSDYLFNNNNKPILNCKEFSEKIGFPEDNFFKVDYLNNCTDLSNSEISKLKNLNYPHFKVSSPIDNLPLPLEARILHGSNYLYHYFQSPERLIFVDGFSKSSLILPISNKNSLKNSVFMENIDNLNNLTSINELMGKIISTSKGFDNNKIIINDIARINKNFDASGENFKELNEYDFSNPSDILAIKESLNHLDIGNSLDSKLYSNILNEYNLYPDGDYPKYFHEPSINDKYIGGSHYDWRFFNIKETYNEFKRISILNNLIKAWLRFSNNENFQTWLSHGTLLGYSFNNLMLPWDFDHDVQVSSSTMWKMAKFYNQSLIIDTTINDKFSSGYGKYFLDISSNFFNRSNTNGNNQIDARFIDIDNGMYIDITQLSYIPNKETVLKTQLPKAHDVFRLEFSKLLRQSNLSIDSIIENNDLIGCKNFHFYTFDEVSQFKKVRFEGEDAFIPTSYAKILNREFPDRKKLWSEEGYTWRSKLGMWVKNSHCTLGSWDRTGDSCTNHQYLDHFKRFYERGNDGEICGLPNWEILKCGIS